MAQKKISGNLKKSPWVKYPLFVLAVLGWALAVIGSLEPFLKLEAWADFLVTEFHNLLGFPFRLIFNLLKVELPNGLDVLLTAITVVMLMLWRASTKDDERQTTLQNIWWAAPALGVMVGCLTGPFYLRFKYVLSAEYELGVLGSFNWSTLFSYALSLSVMLGAFAIAYRMGKSELKRFGSLIVLVYFCAMLIYVIASSSEIAVIICNAEGTGMCRRAPEV